jgi:hypothetical protein
MNELEETLKTLLKEQINRNSDLHATLQRVLIELNEARGERDRALAELSVARLNAGGECRGFYEDDAKT